MKRDLYEFLSTDLQFVKGVGPVLAARFDELLGGRRIADFLLHIPRAVKSRPPVESVIDAAVGEIITIPLEIRTVRRSGLAKFGRRPAPTKVFGFDKLGGEVVIQFFGNSFIDYWLEKLPIGEMRMVSGKLEESGGKFVISHPDFVEPLDKADNIPSFQAIYPMGAGLTQRIMANVRDQIFSSLQMEESAMPFIGLLKKAHYPQSSDDLLPENENIQRLAYGELFADQLAMAISRHERENAKERRTVRKKISDLYEKMSAALPFALTGAQVRALVEISADMEADKPMMRLVQGDVGSGKTAVALMAMMRSLDFGHQSVLLSPTDALAQQHFANINPMCQKLGLVCELLTGRDKGAIRHAKLVSLASGRTNIAVGTHALFFKDVEYKNLGLAVIDEQHRFGVEQRSLMAAKGKFVDILALSATPIPRTLSMTIYGDMDISVINEKPAGRLPIITAKLPISRTGALIERIKTQMPAKAFWVCPLVEESEASDMMNVEARAAELSRHFKVGLVHGKMDKAKRDEAMEAFASGPLEILVATSVIEVGIDVPDAAFMVIENAERFGLSALHQLRGRVGRGKRQSYCILLHGYGLSENGDRRLSVLCESNDGFLIAEQDLMMRGTGEILGSRQSGWLNYRFVDCRAHRDLFKFAVEKAKEMASGAITEEAGDLMWLFGKTGKMGFLKGCIRFQQ
ncbi:MAG: ATP-dependent DNA helicase RecG [Rickettsiales bacterium]|jgi:ATP-dependent DNA helicase RecG|nr:ATP-dependent DNA helicase RecG [Rickettsiales bacterium]